MRGWSRKPNCSESDSRTDVGDYGERCFSEHLCKSIQEEETKTLGHSEVTDLGKNMDLSRFLKSWLPWHMSLVSRESRHLYWNKVGPRSWIFLTKGEETG